MPPNDSLLPNLLTCSDLMQMLSSEDYVPITEDAMYALRDILTVRLELLPNAFTFDFDQNYSSAYSLAIYTDADGVSCAVYDASYVLIVMLSRVADLFLLYGLHSHFLESTKKAFAVDFDLGILPEQLQQWAWIVAQELTTQGRRLVAGDVLQETVEGRVTELDGIPAKVYEVFFSEIL